MMEGEIDIRVGRVRIDIDSAPDASYPAGIVVELKRAIVQVCLAMDTDEARNLAQRVEGAQ